MEKCRKTVLLIAAPVLLAGSVGLAVEQGKTSEFNYNSFDALLKTYVNDNGMVNYKGLKANRSQLDEFVATLGKLHPKTYEKWNQKDKIAFWLNAYNALTLRAIIDHYPIKSSFTKSLTWPKNSIRQIDGAWNKIKFDIMGQKLTLEHIEHKILRTEFSEPRIHMALVCAAMSCPPLRNEPYIAVKLDKQLDDQTKKFLSDPAKFRLDIDKAILHLSPIFKWFANDFAKSYPRHTRYRGHKGPTAAVIWFIDQYLPKQDSQRRSVDSRTYKRRYLDYDWSLNEQKYEAPENDN
jgi:hypothetical protein